MKQVIVVIFFISIPWGVSGQGVPASKKVTPKSEVSQRKGVSRDISQEAPDSQAESSLTGDQKSSFQKEAQEKPSQGQSKTTKYDMSDAQPEDITNENYPDIIDSFDFQDADLIEVIKAMNKLTKKNIILDNKKIRGKITILAPSQITVAEAYKAFLSALAMNGLTIVPSGKFLKIMSAKDGSTE